MASPAAILQVFVNANTKAATAQIAAFDKQLKGTAASANASSAAMGGKMAKGTKMAAAGFAALGAAGVVAGKQLYDLGAQFDEAYDTIRVRTGATGRELERLKGSFKSVSKTVPNDFKDVGIAIGDLNTRLGLTGKPLERMAENMLNLSRITGDDLEGNIKSVARAFVDWEVTIPQQTRYLDGLFRLSQKSGASVTQLADSVQKFGSPLRQLGFSFAEAASTFAAFERAGVNTQTMVPGLRLAISNLTRPTETLAATMAKLGIETGKPDKALRQVFKLLGSSSNLSQVEKTGLAMDVFGKRAGADMAEAIKQGRFEVERYMRVFRNGDDTIKKAADDTDDLSENLGKLRNQVSVLIEPLASGLFGALSDVSRVLANLDFSKINNELVSLPTGAIEVRDALGFMNSKFLESVPILGQMIGAAKLAGGALSGLKSILGKDTETSFQERLKKTDEVIRNSSQNALSSLTTLGEATKKEEGLRARQRRALEATRKAQGNFLRVRNQAGPNSQRAIEAENKYQEALAKSTRLNKRLEKAERLKGAAKRAAKTIAIASIETLKTEIVENRKLIRQKERQINQLNPYEARDAKKIIGLTREINQLKGRNREANASVSKIILRAANQVNPRFAKSLERITNKNIQLRKALPQLGGAAKRLEGVGGKAFRGLGKKFDNLGDEAGKSSKRIKRSVQSIPGPVRNAYGRLEGYANSAAQAFGSKSRVNLSFRRGGMAKFSGPGLVPAMVSPGELISYRGREVYVPGRPEPRDSVMMHLPPGAKVFTFDGQARMAMGASQNEALKKQAPHFATGGIVANAPKPKLVGGARVPRATGQAAIDRARDQAMDWVKRLKPTLDMITRIARGFGLDMTSGYRPGDDGYHGVDRARDYSNSDGPTREMFKFGTYVADNYQKHLLELIYTPLGFGIKNGARTAPYAAADHYDHVHVAMGRGGIVPRLAQKFRRGGWVKTGYTVFDDPGGGYRGHLQRGRGYAELGTATQGGVATGRGYIARALGMSGELRDKFPLDVLINGRQRKMYKRDRGYGQGTPAYSIDIYKDSWGHFGLNANSKGKAFVRKAVSREKIRKVKKAARAVMRTIRRARRKGGVDGFLDAAKKNAVRALRLARDGDLDAARDRLAKARRQIKKAMKARKPEKKKPRGPFIGGALAKNATLIERIEEELELADRLHSAEFSEEGSEKSETELQKEISILKRKQAAQIKRFRMLSAAWKSLTQKKTGVIDRLKKQLEKAPKNSKSRKKIKRELGRAQRAKDGIAGNLVDLIGLNAFALLRSGEKVNPSSIDLGGALGGTNFELKQLGFTGGATPGDDSEIADPGIADSEIADLLRQQLEQAQRALAIQQAQMPVFQQFMPRFHQGGIVQGPMGAERPVMAQAGEGIFTRDQMRAMGSQNITVVIEDAAIDSNRIRVEVDGVIQDKVSTVRRQGSNRRFVTSR